MRFNFSFLILVCLILFIFVGCAAFRATVDEIKDDPAAFKAEAKAISEPIGAAFPTIPYAACAGIGYGLSFLRRLYKNYKKKEAQAKTTA